MKVIFTKEFNSVPKCHPTLTSLNAINLSYSDDQIDHNISRQINEKDNGSINSFSIVLSNLANIASVGHYTKLPGHAIANTPVPSPALKQDDLKDKIDDIGSKDSGSQI